jgi:hypothetical protein
MKTDSGTDTYVMDTVRGTETDTVTDMSMEMDTDMDMDMDIYGHGHGHGHDHGHRTKEDKPLKSLYRCANCNIEEKI